MIHSVSAFCFVALSIRESQNYRSNLGYKVIEVQGMPLLGERIRVCGVLFLLFLCVSNLNLQFNKELQEYNTGYLSLKVDGSDQKKYQRHRHFFNLALFLMRLVYRTYTAILIIAGKVLCAVFGSNTFSKSNTFYIKKVHE